MVTLLLGALLSGAGPVQAEDPDDPEHWEDVDETVSTVCLNPTIRSFVAEVNDTAPLDVGHCAGENDEEFRPGEDTEPAFELAKGVLRVLEDPACSGSAPGICESDPEDPATLSLSATLAGSWTLKTPLLNETAIQVDTEAGDDPLVNSGYQGPVNGTWSVLFSPTEEGTIGELDYTIEARIGDEVLEIRPPVAAGAGNLDTWQMSPATWVFNAHKPETVACAPALPGVCDVADPLALLDARFFLDGE